MAREIARLNKLKFTGTAGVLLKSKAKGYIPEIKPVIERLKEAGFFLRQELIEHILAQAGEIETN